MSDLPHITLTTNIFEKSVYVRLLEAQICYCQGTSFPYKSNLQNYCTSQVLFLSNLPHTILTIYIYENISACTFLRGSNTPST